MGVGIGVGQVFLLLLTLNAHTGRIMPDRCLQSPVSGSSAEFGVWLLSNSLRSSIWAFSP